MAEGRDSVYRSRAFGSASRHALLVTLLCAVSYEANAALVKGDALSAVHHPTAAVRGANLQANRYPTPPATEAPSSTASTTDKGGTACRCVCGDRIMWNREVFAGNVVSQKEHECEHQVCPQATVPGLKVQSKCTYVKDMAELTAGTMCNCQCGDRIAWQRRVFYGDVREEMEKECLTKICPRVNPVPGYRFTAQCNFDRRLFAQPVQQPKARAARSAILGTTAVLTAVSALAAAGLP